MHLSASIHDNIGVNVYLDKDKCVYAETNPYISYTYLFVCEWMRMDDLKMKSFSSGLR